MKNKDKMQVQSLNLEGFLLSEGPIFDVRSPMEYQKGHLPGAINLPLLDNEERALIGTLYKQVSPQSALLEGLRLASPKFTSYLEKVIELTPHKKLRVYCARGGMRSQFMASLFSLNQNDVVLLNGGYKTFRRASLNLFERTFFLRILGGYTGSGKTEILQKLRETGEQVIDLEHLARHKGSAYGAIGEKDTQPTTEHFENRLAYQLMHCDLNQHIWVEDESRYIGSCYLPKPFYLQMREAPLAFIKIPKEKRIKNIIKEYASKGLSVLCPATEKIRKRLGYERTDKVLNLLQQENPEGISLLLDYYDKAYGLMLDRRGDFPIETLSGEDSNLLQKLAYFASNALTTVS